MTASFQKPERQLIWRDFSQPKPIRELCFWVSPDRRVNKCIRSFSYNGVALQPIRKLEAEMENLDPFKKYNDQHAATYAVNLLHAARIFVKVREFTEKSDAVMGGQPQPAWELSINKKDFKKAEDIIEQDARAYIRSVPKDYYLFDFETEELFDVLAKPDEWNEMDLRLARSILMKRGEKVNDQVIADLRLKRIEDLKKPDEISGSVVFLAYIGSLLTGVIGMFGGWHMWKGEKTLPDGFKMLTYSEGVRKHGRNVFILGCIAFPLLICGIAYLRLQQG